MIDIEELKSKIVERLKPLSPNKIILFGSYAYGIPNEDSDIDLYLIKNNLSEQTAKKYTREARKKVRDLIFQYKIGFDILAAPEEYIRSKEDYFYKVDILQKGKILYNE